MTEKLKNMVKKRNILHSGISNQTLRDWQSLRNEITSKNLMYPVFIILELNAGALGIVLCLYAFIKVKTARRQRRFKVRPINRSRRTSGHFNYYQKMKSWDNEQYFKFTRMTPTVFQELLVKVKPFIERGMRSDGISAEERLVLTLQYLSQGCSMQSLAWAFNIGLTTVHVVLHETCRVLWEILSPEYLKSPETEDRWLEIAAGFENKWNFYHCLGAIDGKHINIQAPANSGSLFYNYKHNFSIVLLAACDSDYLFTLVDVGAYGSQSDGGIFKNSVFGQRLELQTMNIPKPKNLPNSETEMLYFFVADEAFPLKAYLMRPFPGKDLSLQQKIFNYRLSRARQVIENTFGILVARWRILKTVINAKVENVDNIVKATVVLHNFCKIKLASESGNLYCPPGFVDDGEKNGNWRNEQGTLTDLRRQGSNIAKRTLYRIREKLSEYFMSESGKVPWQEEAVNKGRQFI